MQSKAETVAQYLAELPDDRRDAITSIRSTILTNLPKGYDENMRWGMITYEVPLSIKDETYNGQPLMYAALASQKNHIGIYLSAVYVNTKRRELFEAGFKATGKKLDMGKSCVRVKKLEDVPLDVLAETISSVPVEDFVTEYEQLRG